MPGRLTGIAERHHRIKTNDWQLLTPRHAPADDLRGHLEFALKWEGVDLGVLSALFRVVPDEEVSALLRTEPTGAYTRRLWFLHEWLTQRLLDVPEPGKVRAIPVIDLRSEEHTSELQSQSNLVCRLLLEKKKTCITHRAPSGSASRTARAYSIMIFGLRSHDFHSASVTEFWLSGNLLTFNVFTPRTLPPH